MADCVAVDLDVLLKNCDILPSVVKGQHQLHDATALENFFVREVPALHLKPDLINLKRKINHGNIGFSELSTHHK